jgi:hypothetical protein
MITFLRDWWRGYSDDDIAEAKRLTGQWSRGLVCDPGTVLYVSDRVMNAMSDPSVWVVRRGTPPLIVTDGIVKVPSE